MDFKNIILSLRNEKGYSQEQLAKALHVSKSTVAMWETGQRLPSVEKYEEIADYFNVDMDFLYGRTSVKRKSLFDESGTEYINANIVSEELFPMYKMGSRIKSCRTKQNLTQEELAKKLGLKKSAIAKYENGRVENIKRDTLEKMSKIFGCHPSYLMGWDDTDYIVGMNSDEHILLETYNSLPELSRKRLLKYASSLSSLNKLEEPILNAAHARTDIVIPKDADISEKDIMDDENF